eukprot:gnl/TRDRNA2_/TRDRNA2_169508_c1_seq6.p1 gnl/TRDRNA2_/TRDRNA2_169508_c1~~gnl/TRDRNA2_/TRDRNA2_169508_c1_seq6.p1  ORF type:complete len:367 (+),score=38.09 gnl/TRDRNA2_/TRDRNA2_169508_c1_seq6:50-1150(+)
MRAVQPIGMCMPVRLSIFLFSSQALGLQFGGHENELISTRRPLAKSSTCSDDADHQGKERFWARDQWEDLSDWLPDLEVTSEESTALPLHMMKESGNSLHMMRDNGTTFLAEPWSRVIVLPKHKLAFCWIEKNACTEFNKLFNRLNHIHGRAQPWQGSRFKRFNLTIEKMSHAEGWKWATFLREPRARYLSAFGSKCVQREENGTRCEPRTAVVEDPTNKTALLAQFEESVRFNLHDNLHRSNLNPHYAEQGKFCGGLRNLGLDYVGILEGDVHGQVEQMLRSVGFNDTEGVVSKFFPRGQTAGHTVSKLDRNNKDHVHTSLEGMSTSEKIAHFYQSNSILDDLTAMYSSDFALYKEFAARHRVSA